jgi:hypothetical protein
MLLYLGGCHRPYHLRYPANVIITAAYEAYQCFPGILTEDAHTLEGWGFLLEISICFRPLVIERAQIKVQTKVAAQ